MKSTHFLRRIAASLMGAAMMLTVLPSGALAAPATVPMDTTLQPQVPSPPSVAAEWVQAGGGQINDLSSTGASLAVGPDDKLYVTSLPPSSWTMPPSSINYAVSSGAGWVKKSLLNVPLGDYRQMKVMTNSTGRVFVATRAAQTGTAMMNKVTEIVGGAEASTPSLSMLYPMMSTKPFFYIGSDDQPAMISRGTSNSLFSKVQGGSNATVPIPQSITSTAISMVWTTSAGEYYVPSSGTAVSVFNLKDGSGSGTVLDSGYINFAILTTDRHHNDVYIAYITINNVIVVKKKQGSSWVNVGDVNGKTATAFAMSTDSHGVPYIAYSDYSQSGKISVKKFDGVSSWNSVGGTYISNSGGTSVNLAAGSDDTLYCAFTSSSTGVGTVVLKYEAQQPTYKVTYHNTNATAGSAPVDSMAYTAGKTATVLSSQTMVRTGYEFAGWNTSELGSGISKSAGDSISITDNVDLYPQWTQSAYHVTYDGNGKDGGTVPVDATVYRNGDPAALLDGSSMTRTGYVFSGWNTRADGKGISIQSGKSVQMTSDVTVYAQWQAELFTYAPLHVTGFNADVIANGSGTVTGSTSGTFDTEYVLYSKDFIANGSHPGITLSHGLPENGTIESANVKTRNASFQLADYSANNALQISNGNAGSLSLATPEAFSSLAVLHSSSNGDTGMNVTVTFTDNTTSVYQLTSPDWFGGADYAIKGLGRLQRGISDADDSAENPRLYDSTLILRDADRKKLVRSMTFSKTSTDMDASKANIFAVSGGVSQNAPGVPANVTATAESVSAVRVGWDKVTGASGYNLDVSTSADFKAPGTSLMIPAGGSNTYLVTGLTQDTTYYVRVRAENGYGYSTNSASASAATLPDKHSVTYKANGSTSGSAPADAGRYRQNDTVSIRTAGSLQRRGYTFTGWNTAANGSGDTLAAGADMTMGSADVTLFAQWSQNSYKVQFNAGIYAEGGTVPSDITGRHYQDSVSVPDNTGTLTRAGYRFVGWNTQDDGTGLDVASGETLVMGEADITLYPRWIQENYHLYYDGNGNDAGQAPQDTNETYHMGDDATVLSNTGHMSRTGYTLEGWSIKGGSEAYTEGNTFSMPAANVTLMAKWRIHSHDVIYSSEGTGILSVTGNYRQVMTVTSMLPLRTGYTFEGWNTQSDGSGTAYAADETLELGDSDITLFAQWKLIPTYTLAPLENKSLPSLMAGYDDGTQTQTVVNLTRTGNAALDNIAVELVSGDVDAFRIIQPDVARLDNSTPSTSFGVAAANALQAGSYSATLRVSAVNMTPVTITVSQTVTVPEAPVIASAVAGNGKVTLNWGAVTGAKNYRIYYGQGTGYYSYELQTSSAATSAEISSLVNGSDYFFTMVAATPGGNSPKAAEVAAVPATVPDAPAMQKPSVSGTSVMIPGEIGFNGGRAVNAVVVYVYKNHEVQPGLETTASDFPVTVAGLTAGETYEFKVKAVNEIGSSEFSEVVSATIPAASSGAGTSTGTAPVIVPGTASSADVLVNGKVESVGTATDGTQGDRKVTTISVDPDKLEKRLQSEGNHAVITIPVNTGSDIVVGELNGQIVRNMEDKQSVVEVRTSAATYRLPAEQINIRAISEQLGRSVELKDIRVQIEIATATADTVKVVESLAKKGEFVLVAKPVDFTIRCVSGQQTVDISKFQAYVERTVAIPEGVDPAKITTAVVLEANGSLRHVPTRITYVNGKAFAVVNSLTNSTYSLVYHPMTFTDLQGHWAENIVNDMGSRMVVGGMGNGTYEPDRDITRAEFAAIVVKALGLRAETTGQGFTDVSADAWYNGFVSTAAANQLISGVGNGEFRPGDKITREQAMTIVAKAMKLTGMTQNSETGNVLAGFTDGGDTADWARAGVAACVSSGIVSGKGNGTLEPGTHMTRAEVAAIVRKLLQKSGLI